MNIIANLVTFRGIQLSTLTFALDIEALIILIEALIILEESILIILYMSPTIHIYPLINMFLPII